MSYIKIRMAKTANLENLRGKKIMKVDLMRIRRKEFFQVDFRISKALIFQKGVAGWQRGMKCVILSKETA